MAIIVDKEEKRRLIALSCKGLLLENGIKNITVAQIAKAANIGKGTIYEYFANKDEIVFEIIMLFVEQIQDDLLIAINNNNTLSCREKMEYFMMLVFSEAYKKEFSIYKEFLSIALCSATPDTVAFRVNCHNSFEVILETIINQGIENDELHQNAIAMIPMIRYFHTGLIVDVSIGRVNAHMEIGSFINSIFGNIIYGENR